MRRVAVIAREELTLMRSEILPVLIYFVMPVVILAFVRGGFDLYLDAVEDRPSASGADLAAPGQATMFGFMALSILGYFFLGEHGWGTWNRLRATGVRSWQIMAGKLVVAYGLQLVLFTFVMVAGNLLFELHVSGSLAALVLIEMVLALVVVGYGFAACSLATTQAQYNAFSYLGALVLAGLGGALVPFQTLPGWARAVSPGTPTYWAVSAYETIILDAGGLADVIDELIVLSLFAVGLFVLAWWSFDPSKRRSTYA